ncbi:MAG: hypothetical protein KGL39_45975 [Patescibacteria group bacterium]|nr:hypothetical protein [Patescibacteria group bacterium]
MKPKSKKRNALQNVPKQGQEEVKRGPDGKWLPGTTGNPTGGSDKTRNRIKLEALLHERLQRMRPVKMPDGSIVSKQTAEMVIDSALNQLIRGRMGHLGVVFERWGGKMPVTIRGDEDHPLITNKFNELSNEELEKAIIATQQRIAELRGADYGAAGTDAGGPEVHSVRPKNKPLVQGKLASPGGSRKTAKNRRRKS